MGGTLDTIIVCILRIFVLLYLYQTIYMLVGLFCKPKRFTAKKQHRYGDCSQGGSDVFLG